MAPHKSVDVIDSLIFDSSALFYGIYRSCVDFLVVDNRGRWAVCGKSSGILSYKSSSLASASEDSVQSATMEVMPLTSGELHLPYIILHRYLKRKSSEYGKIFNYVSQVLLSIALYWRLGCKNRTGTSCLAEKTSQVPEG